MPLLKSELRVIVPEENMQTTCWPSMFVVLRGLVVAQMASRRIWIMYSRLLFSNLAKGPRPEPRQLSLRAEMVVLLVVKWRGRGEE